MNYSKIKLIHNELNKIWRQVPVDYYDQGIKTNILQKIWHTNKLKTFKDIVKNRKIDSILDVGCASGLLTNEMSKIFPKSKIYGVDIYEDALVFARKKYPSVNFIVADAHKLPFKTSTFDLTVCYETIEHVVDPLKVLKEIHRVTKKGGISILVMDSGSLLFRIVWFLWENSKGKVWKGAHLHPFTHQQLENIIKKLGFNIKQKRFSHLGMEVIFLLIK